MRDIPYAIDAAPTDGSQELDEALTVHPRHCGCGCPASEATIHQTGGLARMVQRMESSLTDRERAVLKQRFTPNQPRR